MSVSEFYKNRTVFVTGGTGFVGKVLIYRLLVSCPDIERIFVLVRPTEKQNPQERLLAVLRSMTFGAETEARKDLLKKVVAVSGDIVSVDLGLRQDDLDLLFQSVSVVFHTAATIKFDETLKTAIDVNVSGTKKLLILCRQMKQLQTFVHVSTAYSNCHKKVIEEIVYEPVIPPDHLIRALEWLDDAALASMTSKIIPPWPNTYTYAKALAESVVKTDEHTFMVGIVRPSIIGASLRFPHAGYMDNYNGPSGMLAAIGKGALRTMLGDRHATADWVPVDCVVDILVGVPWHLAKHPVTEAKVYNFTSGPVNPITWQFVQDRSYAYFMKNPVDNIYRIPCPKFTQSRIMHRLWVLVDHLLPAYMIDLVSLAQAKKPMVVKSYRKLHKAVQCLDYFTSNSWDFRNDNVKAVWESLSVPDRQEFNIDLSKMNWEDYMEKYCLGVKIFLLRERVENLPQARLKLEKRVNIARITTGSLLMVLVAVISRRTKFLRHSWMISFSMVIRLLMLLFQFLSSNKT